MDLQQLIDIEAIRQVTYKYDWAWDGPDDVNLMLSIFTDDCIFDESDSGLPPVVGHAALAATYKAIKPLLDWQRKPGNQAAGSSLHYTGHHVVTFQDKDHATCNSYVIGKDYIRNGLVAADCVYMDQLVRTKDGWKIKVRRLEDLTPPIGHDLIVEAWAEAANTKA